ncbi:MAG: glycosyltransferase [Candidatus Sericytochromatia bacterium]|nr:glycosyltransferase [Candidatus Tanganyikabacteria bacterium]
MAMRRYQATVLSREARRIDDTLTVSTTHASLRLLARLGSPWPYIKAWSGPVPSLVHAHFGPDGVAAMPIARAWGCPLFVTYHGFDATIRPLSLLLTKKPTNWAFVAQRRAMHKMARRVIAVSNFIGKSLISSGCDAEKIVTIYTGINTSRFNSVELDLGPRRILVAVARHIAVKGLDILIRAHARLAGIHPDIRLVLVGQGPLTQSLKDLVTSLGTSSLVDFTPFVPQTELPRLYRQSLALILPSRQASDGQTEGLGMVLLEAAACGTPVIGSQLGGIPEALDDGRTGLLVPPDDPDALAQALIFLADHEDKARQMGRAGRDWVARNFDVDKQTAKLELLYDEALG